MPQSMISPRRRKHSWYRIRIVPAQPPPARALEGQAPQVVLAGQIRRQVLEGIQQACGRAHRAGRWPLHLLALSELAAWLRGQPTAYWLDHQDRECWREHFRAWRAELPASRQAALWAEVVAAEARP